MKKRAACRVGEVDMKVAQRVQTSWARSRSRIESWDKITSKSSVIENTAFRAVGWEWDAIVNERKLNQSDK